MADVQERNPAEQAAHEAQKRLLQCIDSGHSFLLEAGAGAGKTHSLIHALRYIIDKMGVQLRRRHQRIACITFTNVANDEIRARTDDHPVVKSDTIHSFCWSLIKDFQLQLRDLVPTLRNWPERLAQFDGVGTRTVEYSLGYPMVGAHQILLHHDDVLSLTIQMMRLPRFQLLVADRYPILLIDEYQDTDAALVEAIKEHFLDTGRGPLLGLFGDHWQKIYGDGCGKIDHPALERIDKHCNFRSVPAVVNVLNRMRPRPHQHVTDPNAPGFVAVYHTNEWAGCRRTSQHWAGDLPPEDSQTCLNVLKSELQSKGWDLSPQKTKVLMLTHKLLAKEQGYSNLAGVFKYNEMYIKKEDPHIAFLLDTVEPMCKAFEAGHYGEMFAILGGRPAIRSHQDKVEWTETMNTLLELRAQQNIGVVIDHLRKTGRISIPPAVEQRERERERMRTDDLTDDGDLIQHLREVKYQEIRALDKFIDRNTPFATKHSVKGAEFENVLVVVGRGWNKYDFNQMLVWAADESRIPPNKREAFESNRNLFYVVCSRPKTRLALLFTQKLSDKSLETLENWFGPGAIHVAPPW